MFVLLTSVAHSCRRTNCCCYVFLTDWKSKLVAFEGRWVQSSFTKASICSCRECNTDGCPGKQMTNQTRITQWLSQRRLLGVFADRRPDCRKLADAKQPALKLYTWTLAVCAFILFLHFIALRCGCTDLCVILFLGVEVVGFPCCCRVCCVKASVCVSLVQPFCVSVILLPALA